MKGQTVSFIYVLNIVMQALFSLLFSVAVFFGIGYLAVNSWGAPTWVYVPLILAGVGVGLWSMIRFILSALAGLDRLEKQREKYQKKP